MKLKRCFKTVLSSVLAAAMLITAVPSNLTLDVQAAPAEETVVETEVTTEESTVAAEDVAATVGTTTDVTEEETTTEAVVEEKEENVEPEADVDNSVVDSYLGPTMDYSNGKVKIYWYGESDIPQIMGGWNGWTLVDLTAEEGQEGIYSIEIAQDTLSSFEYIFKSGDSYPQDPNNTNTEATNSKILRNPAIDSDKNVTLYYYPSEHGAYPETVKVQYRVAGSETEYTEVTMQTNVAPYKQIYSVTLSGLEDAVYEYQFVVNETTVQDGNNVNGSTGTFTLATYPDPDPDKVEAEVIGKKVTFSYYGPTNRSVSVVGSLNGWDSTADVMTYDENTGYWTVEKTLSAGKYEYKFFIDGDYEGGSNKSFVITGLVDDSVDVKRDGSAKLDAELDCYDSTGTVTTPAVTYTKSEATAAAEWTDKVTLTTEEVEGVNVTTVAVAADFPADVESFTLTAKDASDNTSTVTVNVKDAVYNYTIYYYDADQATGENGAMTATDATLYIWQPSTTGNDGMHNFSSVETLADGRTWAKVEVTLSHIDLGIITKIYGTEWNGWQDADRYYTNTDKKENVTLYIVNDDATVYTELPEIKEVEKRYIVVEYTRTDGKEDTYYFRTWNNGYAGEFSDSFNASYYPFEEKDGKYIATVPVKAGVETVNYNMVAGSVVGDEVEPDWSTKDGGDHGCAMPSDQTIVKIKMEQDKSITYTYPYNIGYEFYVDGSVSGNSLIHFYYRDDADFLAGSTSSYASAQVEINGTAYDMTWDAEEQRYEYDMPNLVSGTYKYRYLLKETAESEATAVLDKYNEATVVENEIEYSVCEYALFEAIATAKMFNASMDYNDNNVLTVKLAGVSEEADISTLKPVKAYADLSALGGSSEAAIDTELLELSVSVKEGVETGNKTIPVTVFDQYGNKYTAEASVEVVARNKGNDFDWDEAVIYFTVTDRFYDGKSSNNNPGYDKSENGGSSYHGGDFAGLTKKLDYLKDLGVNTIWITPIVENEMEDGLTTKVEGIKSWGYHGYWASDFTKLDSHLGTEREFKKLLDEAHKRGMKIMVDVVLNHAGYNNEEYFNSILKDEEGNPIPMIRTDKEMVQGSDQKKSLDGLPDFLTENAEVRNLLVEWQSNWVSKYDIDYYRVDTVKHVDDTTWSAFKNALTKINPDFKMIGEHYGAGYSNANLLDAGRMDSLLDFDFNNQAADFVNGNISNVENFMNARNAAIDNTGSLGAFMSSHDEEGFVQGLVGSGKSKESAEALAKVAASLQITAKGQTVIYYGEEIGMTGANDYPYQTNRYDFDWTAVNAENDTLTHYKKMLDIREKYSEVFAKGSRNTIAASNEGGYDVFAKTYGGTTVYTALNIGDAAVEYTLTGLTPGAFMTDIYGEKLYQVDETGAITITIPAAADGGTAVIVERDVLDTLYVQCIDAKAYAGSKTTLTADELKVYYGYEQLTEGTDYKVSYKNNTKVGTATVTVTGKGNFAGKETVSFEITRKNVLDNDITVNYQDNMIYAKKNLKPLTSVVYNGKKLGTKDYSVEYYKVETVSENEIKETKVANVKDAGNYKMVITGKGNFEGTVEKEVTVHEATDTCYVKDLKFLIGGAKSYSVPYDGKEQEPAVTATTKAGKEVTVSCNSVNGADLVVSYSNNVNVGNKATITITGNPANGYFGTVTKTFKITATAANTLGKVAKIDDATWAKTVAYDVSEGKGIQAVGEDGKSLVKLVPKAADSNLTFEEGKQYKVSYLKNDKPGTATMVFTGINNYTGTIKKTFKIDKAEITAVDVTVAESAPYLKKGAKAAVTVVVDGKTLTAGKDYKVTYKNNKAVTTDATAKKPCATITGIGSFKGTVKEVPFKVTEESFANVNVSATDVVVSNKTGKFMATPVVTDAEGTKLGKNDYLVKYEVQTVSDNDAVIYEEVGKTDTVSANNIIRVTVTAKEGDARYVDGTSSFAFYEVEEGTVTKATVKIAAQVYTGKEVKLSAEDFTSVKVGKETLTYGEDFVVKEGTYKNHINKGTASVTIEGIGNYGGEKTVTFKITSRTVAWWWNLLH